MEWRENAGPREPRPATRQLCVAGRREEIPVCSVSRLRLVFLGRRDHQRIGDNARLLTHLGLDGVSDIGVIPQELLGIFPTLADPLA